VTQPTNDPQSVPDRNEYERQRRLKRDQIVELGLLPYGERTADTDARLSLADAADRYNEQADQHHKAHSKDEGFIDERPVVTVAGRVVLIRDNGKLVWMNLRDETGDLQIAASKRDCDELGFALAKLTDLADLIVATGPLVRTRTGETTIWVTSLRPAAKCLVPPPEKHAGLADIEARKPALITGGLDDGSLLAIVVIEPNAVIKDDAGYGSYELFLRNNLDDRFEDPLRKKVKNAIINARFSQAGEDRAHIAELLGVKGAKATIVTDKGEHASTGGQMNFFIAMGFMMLLWISVFSGGQYLMMTVIEEKSSRVMEVLLSAVSPRQLMTGKIIGQMGVALSILGVYLTISIVALDRFNFLYLINPSELGLVVVYFFIAFFLIAALMAAIGSAVTEIREAQSLMMPVMMVMIIPMILDRKSVV